MSRRRLVVEQLEPRVVLDTTSLFLTADLFFDCWSNASHECCDVI